MSETMWADVDRFFEDRLLGADEDPAFALEASRDRGLPEIAVSPGQGKMLMLLARMSRAARILEIGTLGGYSTIWLARALPADGTLVSLEIEAAHADVARDNLAAAGLADRVEVRLGPAVESLEALAGEGQRFDFIFVDADKAGLPDYFRLAMEVAHTGTVLVFDNVVRRGRVLDESGGDPGVEGVRRLTDLIAAEPRVSATSVQTVGAKGYDGFTLALVTG
ncbi:O-methyltransferase [Amorphus orientalis]|uniref:O-methyltransferase YrrM n=1 Tax=Amorphus orientalis TaxID=649198 RepID=A0AAE4AQZ0_9HYPH|nr:O-methyltransferase [Amorphus orientalis]MDQ0313663.1 putative O-methyltransferase YrrM [Amorphus orientalis]